MAPTSSLGSEAANAAVTSSPVPLLALGSGNNEKKGAVMLRAPFAITGEQPSVRYPPRRNTRQVKECSILLAAIRIVELRLCLQ